MPPYGGFPAARSRNKFASARSAKKGLMLVGRMKKALINQRPFTLADRSDGRGRRFMVYDRRPYGRPYAHGLIIS